MAIIKTIYTRPNGSIGVKISSDKPSKTNPNYKKEVDVNNIIERFLKTGQLTHTNPNPGQYIDQTQSPQDLQTSLHFVSEMENVYKNLNKKFKNRFKSINEFLEFAENPKNEKELLEILGQKQTTNQTTTKKDPETTTPLPTKTESVQEKPS